MSIFPHAMLNSQKQRKRKTTAKTPEGKVKNSVKELLHNYDVWYCMPGQNGYGRAGIPDFLCCKNGLFFAIETKSKFSSHTLTALQAKEIDAITTHGGKAFVINEDNLADLDLYLKEIA